MQFLIVHQIHFFWIWNEFAQNMDLLPFHTLLLVNQAEVNEYIAESHVLIFLVGN